MFGSLRKRWNAARQRRFQDRAARYLRLHFGEVIGGSDGKVLAGPEALDGLHSKYFGDAA